MFKDKRWKLSEVDKINEMFVSNVKLPNSQVGHFRRIMRWIYDLGRYIAQALSESESVS